MTIQDKTLALIIEYGLTVRQIPLEKVSLWGYYEGAKLLKGAEIVEKDGCKFMKTVEVSKHAGKWMAKKSDEMSTQVTWNIKTDNLSDTLQEAVEKAVQSI